MLVKQEEEDNQDVLYVGYKLADPTPETVARPFEASKERTVLQLFVELPTWKEIQEKKIKEGKLKGEWIQTIKNPKVKIKAGLSLSHETLSGRIGKMNCPVFDINLDREILDVAVPREFLSDAYGGNPQVTLPSIGKKFLDQHGYNDFMYPSLEYNPEAAQIPGAPGLFFAVGDHAREWPTIQRVITRIVSNQWQYVGQYALTPTKSLTIQELKAQPEKFLTTWGRETCNKSWGQHVVRRIAARKRFKRINPTKAQLQAIEDSGEYKNVTPEDVKAALMEGEEVMGVWEMRCVGYDEEFQREISERFKRWTPKPKKPRGKKGEGEKGSKSPKKPLAGKKRKRAETPSSSSTESDSEEIIILDDDSD